MSTAQRTAIAVILCQLQQGIYNRAKACKAIKETYFLKG